MTAGATGEEDKGQMGAVNVEPLATPGGGIRLHTPVGFLAAGLLGGPLAGAWLVGQNLRRLGQLKASRRWMVLGLFGMLGYGFLLWYLPGWMLPIGLIVVQGVGIYGAGSFAVGKALVAREEEGIADEVENFSIGRSARVGMVLAVILFGVLGGMKYLEAGDYFAPSSRRVAFGAREDVIYFKPATTAEARQLGQALTDAGYFTGGNHTALLAVDASGKRVISVLWPKERWSRTGAEDELRKLGQNLLGMMGSKSIIMRAVDEEWAERVRTEVP